MFMTRGMLVVVAALGVATTAFAAVKTEEFEYRQGDTVLQGFLAWNDKTTGRAPGVLVVHEWWGHNAHARHQAKRLAAAGYVALALDMYGKGKLALHPSDAEAFMQEATKDPEVVAARFNAALDLLRKNPRVDPARIAAIGYCFGGGVVLEMTRSGADLKAVATFHGSLGTASPASPGKIKPRILVMTGTADPLTPASLVTSFKKEMSDAGAKFEVISYPGAKHSFTNPNADKAGVAALAYNAKADHQSWAALLKFFRAALR